MLKQAKRESLLAMIAILALALPCAAAPGTSVVLNATSPGGFIYDGTHLWVTDAALGFCRMDASLTGFTLTNCIRPPTSSVTFTSILGQPAYDAVNRVVYLPDKSAFGFGIWRYAFNGTTFDPASALNIAPQAGLGSQRPNAISIGSDGNLYVTVSANSSILRVHLSSQTVDNMATTANGKPATGIAIVGTQAWIAESDGVLLLPDPVGCGTKCRGALNTQLGLTSALSITFDSVNALAYIGNASGVFQNNLVTGQTVLYSASYVKNGVPGLYSNVTAVGVDPTGNLFIGDDPTLGQDVGGATIYEVPAGSTPDGVGPTPSTPPTPTPTIITPALANPAALVSSGLTTPKGSVFMGTHVWVVDTLRGFCRVDPGTPAPSLSNCALLPAGFVPGSPALDSVNNLVYLPDTTVNGAGIVMLPFSPATETVGTPTTVVRDSVLTPLAPGSTAPTSLAFGPDGQLYVAMAGTASILRVTAPSAPTHTVRVIGSMNDTGALSIAFHNADLWDAEKTNASFIHNATLCAGTCSATFLGVFLSTPGSVASDSNFVYIGDRGHVWQYDPVANTLQDLADTGLLNGTPTQFVAITGIALDSVNQVVYAADAGPLWRIQRIGPQLLSVVPGSSTPGTSVAVTIGGAGLTGGTLNMPAGITATGVTVVSDTKMTATFAVAANATIGTNLFTATTAQGTSNPLAFVVNAPLPVLTSITPTSGVQGSTFALTITGTNLTGATLNLPAGVTATGVTATSTQVTATLTIAAAAPIGTTSISVATAGGGSNALPFSIVLSPPILTAITPTTGVTGTNVAVTVTGTNLAGATLNLPLGITTSAAPVVTATQITATFVIAANAALGPQNITASNAAGASNAVIFTVNPPPPVLTGITPTSGVQGTNVALTLTGTNLTGSTLNLPSGITASGVTISATQVTATLAIAANATLGAQNITVTTAGGTSNAVTITINPPAPVLTSITPNSGTQGASVAVTIAGTNLTGAALNLPTGITTSAAPVVDPTGSQITATFVIAANAATGALNITVTTAGGTSSAVSFTVNPPAPALTGITPNSGGQGASVAVTIAGTNLTGSTLNLPAGITASGVTISATQIAATLAIAANATLGAQSITVTTPGGTSGAVTFTVNPPAPVLTGITPNSGVQGASVAVTITGTNLTAATLNVPAAITASAVTVVSDTQITATFVGNSAGSQNITVTTASGTSNAMIFTVNPPAPVLAGIAPNSGAQGASVAVTITGTSLTGATLNLPAGISASGITISATQITATLAVASNATLGPQNITVTTAGGTSNAITFTVNAPAPTLAGITPNSGVLGATVAVTITGSHLTGGTLNVSGGIAASAVTVVNDTQITASFLANSTGPQSVTVTTTSGTSNALTFIVNPPAPTLTGITPNSGTQGTNVAVILAGTNLTGATLNLPAGITASSVTVSATQIGATFTITSAALVGTQNITVTTTGGTSNPVAFTVNPGPPTLAGITPASGTQGTSVAVTLSGTNLTGSVVNLPSGITATAVTATASSVSATFVIASTATLGPQNITVTTGAGTSNAVSFTVVAPGPAIISVSPSTLPRGATTTLTVNGFNLTPTTTVKMTPVAGVSFGPVTFINSGQITVRVTIAANAKTGNRTLTVTAGGLTSNGVTVVVK